MALLSERLHQLSRGVVERMGNATQPGVRSDDLPFLLTVAQAAEYLSVGRTRVYDLMRTGQLKSVKLGSSRRVARAALDEFLDGV
jgi:excisionase family DNA binding protein